MADKEISSEFPFESKYVEVLGSKMHYVEQGSGDPVLFLHGNPTSSYLWRNIIPHVSPYARAMAPDLIGMGKSDKPDLEYRLVDHIKYIDGFIEKLNLKNITFVIHDWGSGIGFNWAMNNQDKTKGLAFMESMLKPFTWDMWPESGKEIFKAMRTPEVGWDLVVNKNIFVEGILPGSVVRGLTEAEMEHYREPFKDPATRKPIWRWPNELSIDGEPADVTEIIEAYSKKMIETEIPKLLFYAEPGAITSPELVDWCRENYKNLQTVNIGPGSHFIQEDNPHLIGEELAKWYKTL